MIYGGVGIDTVAPNKIFIGNNVAITAGTRILTHYLDPSRSGRMFRIGEVHIPWIYESPVNKGCYLHYALVIIVGTALAYWVNRFCEKALKKN